MEQSRVTAFSHWTFLGDEVAETKMHNRTGELTGQVPAFSLVRSFGEADNAISCKRKYKRQNYHTVMEIRERAGTVAFLRTWAYIC